MQLGLNPHLVNESLIISIITVFVWKHSEPPLSTVAFPDLRHNTAASDVTFGLDSYIIDITPVSYTHQTLPTIYSV